MGMNVPGSAPPVTRAGKQHRDQTCAAPGLCQPHPLTFPCINIRSVRVMLSSGSSSSPASELLILSGGAGATAAWECVHAVAQLALDRAAEKRV